jgi:chromosome segregation ATPase
VELDVTMAEQEEDRLEKKVRQKVDEKRKLEDKLEQELSRNEKYIQENEHRHLQKRTKEEEIQQHNTEKEKTLKMYEALKARDEKVEEERRQAETARNQLRQDMKDTQEQTDGLKRDGDGDRKRIEDLLRERDILNKDVTKADDRTKKQIDLVKRQETQAMNLRKDILRWKHDAQDFNKRLVDLEQQREKYGIELSQANAKYFAAKEEMKLKGSALTELNKQIATVQAKRNQQKNLYDAVCMDRNKHAKDCMESKEQIAEMRRKFTIMFHQTAALKEEIREKDNDLVKGHFKHKKVRDLIEKLKTAKDKAERREKNLKNIVETQKTQMKKLESTIQEAEQERQAQQKELEGVIGERDILGAQLIRRNEELALLYEKIKIQQSTLQKGEVQYNDRLREVERLRGEIRKTKADVALARTQVTNVDGLKREVHHLSKTLLREEAKLKALQEEMANPMNVHRWRELEGSDPQTYEMIQKVKSLQKLLISKTEEVVEKDSLIQEKEKLYVQLKSIIARQPGPEVAEQLAWYSQNLKDKTRHMKQMAEELESYHMKVGVLKDEIDRHNKDLSSIKQAYFQRLRQRNTQAVEQ